MPPTRPTWSFSTSMTRCRFETVSHDVEENEWFRREHLSFQSTLDERVTAYYYQPRGASPGNATLIVLHTGTPAGKDAPFFSRLSERLVRAGWCILTIDAKHFGERETGLFVAGTDQERHDKLYNLPAVYLAWITQYVKDVRRSFDFLVSEKGADPGAIGAFRGGVVGRSRGSERGRGGDSVRSHRVVLRRAFRRPRNRSPRSRLSRQLHRKDRPAAALHHQFRERRRPGRGALGSPPPPVDRSRDRSRRALDRRWS